MCAQLAARTPCILNKALVGEALAAEALSYLYQHSQAFTLSAPDHLPAFLTHDIFSVDVLARHFSLRNLTLSIISTSTSNSNLPAAAFFTPLLATALHDSLILHVVMQYSDEATLATASLLDLIAPLSCAPAA
jgi:hypothetical protein